MQPYNQTPSYEQNSIGSNINPDSNNLETTINSLNKNQRGSIGKKLLIAGAVVAITAGSIVYALNPFSQEIYPLPTPTNPPIAASPTPTPPVTLPPTETPKPAEIPLEERLPEYGPLSVSEISSYTRIALKIGWEARIAYDAGNSKEVERLAEEAKGWMSRAAYAVLISNSDARYDKHVALVMTIAEWEFGGSVPEDVISSTQRAARLNAERNLEIPSDDKARAKLKIWMRTLEGVIGMPYNAYNTEKRNP